MSTYEQKNSHIRQQAARERALARFPGFAPMLRRRVRPDASTPGLPVSDWFGNLPPQYAIPAAAAPSADVVEQLAAMADAHHARLAALTAHVVPDPILAQHQQQLLQQQLQQQHLINVQVAAAAWPANPQPGHPAALAPTMLLQDQANRLRELGLDLLTANSMSNKSAEEREEHEKKLDAFRKSLTPKKVRLLAAEQDRVKRARIQKTSSKPATRVVDPQMVRDKGLKAIEDMGPERWARACKSVAARRERRLERERLAKVAKGVQMMDLNME